MISSSNSLPPPPIFAGQNYLVWAAKMKAYLRTQSLLEVVDTGSNPPPLPNNPTIAQIRNHNEEVAKEERALAIIHATLHDDVFIKILILKTAKELGTNLMRCFKVVKEPGGVKVLNLRREFEDIKMKESERMKEFSDRLSKVVT